MTICPNCRQNIPDGEIQCRNCGTVPFPLSCSRCGMTLDLRYSQCVHCGQPYILPYSHLLPRAATTESKASFCRHCGAQLGNDALYCPRCGSPIETNHQRTGPSSYASVNNSAPQTQNLVKTLSSRIKTESIIWLVIGILQIVLGSCTALMSIIWRTGLTVWWLMLVVGPLNIIASITDFRFSKAILVKPVGIVKKLKPLGGPIFSLVYNLTIGGVIGVGGSIYHLIWVRGFVLENETQFLAIEKSTETC